MNKYCLNLSLNLQQFVDFMCENNVCMECPVIGMCPIKGQTINTIKV